MIKVSQNREECVDKIFTLKKLIEKKNKIKEAERVHTHYELEE